jgi:exodeoxyribonuclease VII large subunit
LVRNAERVPLRAAAQVEPGQEISIEFHDGEVGAVTHGHASPSERPAKKREGGQGSLF